MRRFVIVKDDGFIEATIDDSDTRIGKLKRVLPFLRKSTVNDGGFVNIRDAEYHWDPKRANPVYIRLGRTLWTTGYLGMQMVWRQNIPEPIDLMKDETNEKYVNEGRTGKAIDNILTGPPIDAWLGRQTDYVIIALVGIAGFFGGTLLGSML